MHLDRGAIIVGVADLIEEIVALLFAELDLENRLGLVRRDLVEIVGEGGSLAFLAARAAAFSSLSFFSISAIWLADRSSLYRCLFCDLVRAMILFSSWPRRVTSRG